MHKKVAHLEGCDKPHASDLLSINVFLTRLNEIKGWKREGRGMIEVPRFV